MFFSSKNKSAPEPIDALSFEADISQRSYKSERLAWLLAVLCLIVAGVAAAAVLVMLPLKQTIPYFVYVDKETGVQQAVIFNDPAEITTNEAVIRYWLSKYVSTRERYVYRLQQEDFDFVSATSSPAVRQDYRATFAPPTGKADLLKDSQEERITVLSAQVTPGALGRGTVRYQKIIWRMGMREPESVRTYVADVAFDWIPVQGWDTGDLLINPLGFSVAAYRTTQELEAR